MTTEEQFLTELGSCLEKGDPFRKKAWDRLAERGPASKMGAFQYVPLRSFYAASFSPTGSKETDISSYVYPECQGSCLVFTDGCFSRELSNTSRLPSQMVIASLSESYRSFNAYLQNRHARFVAEEEDPFALLNASHHQEGAFLYLPPKVECTVPLQILSVVTEGRRCIPRLQLFLGAGSSLKLISRTVGENSFLNDFIDMAIDEGASCDYFSHLDSSAWHFSALRATLKRDSRLNAVSLTCGSRSTRQSFRVSLMGENAEANLQGIALLDHTDQSHTHVLLEHKAPRTRSQQLFKNVLNGSSRSSFEGKIFVERVAQKTEAYQLNRNLLLSDHALACSKPNLEIFADDVKASHGATMSTLNPEEMIYLKSRGLTPDLAQTLLLSGFCKQVIDLVPQELSLHQGMIQTLKAYL